MEAITSQQGQTSNEEDRMENEERIDSWTLLAEEHSKDEALLWASARTWSQPRGTGLEYRRKQRIQRGK